MSDQDVMLRLTVEDSAMQKAASAAENAAKKTRELDAAQKAAAGSALGAGRQTADAFKQVEKAATGAGRAGDQMTRKLVQELKAVQSEASKLGRELTSLRGQYDALHRAANKPGGGGGGFFKNISPEKINQSANLAKMAMAGGAMMASQHMAGSNMEGQVGGATRATGSIAGGAAAGFMVAGPWGALAGGAVAAISSIEDLTAAFGGMSEAAAKGEEALNNAKHARNVANEEGSDEARFQGQLKQGDLAEQLARSREAAQAAAEFKGDPTKQALYVNEGSQQRLQERSAAISMRGDRPGTKFFAQGQREQAAIAAELVNLENERLQLVRKQAEAAVAGGQQALDLANKQVDAAKRLTQEAQNKFLSGQERFGQLSKGDQKEFMRLDAKLAGGQGLSEAESRRAKSLGVDSDALAKLDRARGADFAQTATGAKLAANQRAAEKAEQQAVNVQGEVQVKLDELVFKLDENSIAQQMAPVIEKMIKTAMQAATQDTEKQLQKFAANKKANS